MDQKENPQIPQDDTLSRDVLAKMFGASLRKSREAADYSIERAAIATKISHSFIQALEEGELGRLPGSVFARGFIRNLCKIYQMDAVGFLDAYEKATSKEAPTPAAVPAPVAAHAAAPSPEVVPPAGEEAHKKQDRKTDVQDISKQASEKLKQQIALCREKLVVYLPLLRAQRFQLIAGAAVGAVLVSVLTFFVTDPATQEPDQAAQLSQPSQMPVVMEEHPPASQNELEDEASELGGTVAKEEARVAASAVAKEEAGTVANTASKAATSVGTSTPMPHSAEVKPIPVKPTAQKVEKAPVAVVTPSVPVGTGQTLEIVARQRVVVRLTKDGSAPQNLTLEPKHHLFQFRDEAQVLIFDASVVDVKFNGRSLGPLGKSGRVRRLSFKREELPVHAKL